MNAQMIRDPLHSVLIGTELGAGSDTVVRSGLAVARAAGASIYLVHAVPDGELEHLPRQVEDVCESRLRDQVRRLGIQESELAGAGVFAGAPHQVLLDIAQTVGAGLIVVGATASKPLAAELLGSTADRVLCKAPCPVLLVRAEMRMPPRLVLAPVDLSPLSGDAYRCGLGLLAQIAKGAPVELRVDHALSFLDIAEQRRQRGGASASEVESARAEELRRFVLENGTDAPFHVQTTLLPGEAGFEILRELVERPVDLVMLGTHGRSGPDRLMLGSVASTVARKAPCNVLLISPEAALSEGIAAAILNLTTPAWHREPLHMS